MKFETQEVTYDMWHIEEGEQFIFRENEVCVGYLDKNGSFVGISNSI